MSENINPATALADKWVDAIGKQDLKIERPGYPHEPDRVEDISIHDFSTYIFALDPWADRGKYWNVGNTYSTATSESVTTDDQPALADSGVLQWLDDTSWLYIQSALSAAQNAMSAPSDFHLTAAITLIERFVLQAQVALTTYYGTEIQVRNRRNALVVAFVDKGLADLLDGRFEVMDTGQREKFLKKFDSAVHDWVLRSALSDQPWLAVSYFQDIAYFEFSMNVDSLRSLPATSPQAWSELGYEIGNGFQLAPSIWQETPISGAPSVHTIEYSDELAHLASWDSETICPVPTNFSQPSRRSPTVTFVENASGAERLTKIADEIIALGPSQESQEAEKIFGRLHEIIEALSSDLHSGVSPSGTMSLGRDRQYEFRPYPTGSINLGLEIVYRQEWHPKEHAKGELAKTIPLGPGQVEKVSIRKQERDKISRQMNDVSISEETREATSKTTNSSEVVEEAAKTRRFEIKADGSFNVAGLFGGTVAGPSYGGTSASSSRDTKKSLAEAMSRASSKMRRERKITVSTEREVSYEETRASEIRNPNDEIAVTYYYYTLQQRYLLSTYLATIRPVLFVAEPLPHALDIRWIRRHSWIINRVLLDDSYASTLAQLSTVDAAAVAREVAIAEQQLATTVGALNDARVSLKQLNTLEGDVASTYDGTLRAYQEAAKAAKSLVREYEGILAQARRLADHLADNILHYCRAIWGTEDPERRRMRYQDLYIPTNFIPISIASEEVPPGSGNWEYEGQFQPVPEDPQIMPLSELIDPTGPIAYAGNYSAFRILKTEYTEGLSRLIRQTSLTYCADQTFTISGSDTAAIQLINRDFYAGESFTMRFTGPDNYHVQQYYSGRIEGDSSDGSLQVVEERPGVTGGPELIIHLPDNGIDIFFRELQRAGTVVQFVPNALELRDPELAYLLTQNQDLRIDDLGEMLPKDMELRRTNGGKYELVHQRTLLVDTDNLYLEIDPTPLLETFKQYHRLLDVAMVATDVGRRSRRLDEKIYGDPDIEKVVLVGDSDLAGLVGAAEAGNNDSDESPTDDGPI